MTQAAVTVTVGRGTAVHLGHLGRHSGILTGPVCGSAINNVRSGLLLHSEDPADATCPKCQSAAEYRRGQDDLRAAQAFVALRQIRGI